MIPTSQKVPRKVVVVGAGPVGCLAALSFAKEGWEVELYEARPDLRESLSGNTQARRSVNLAISSRAIVAMASVDPALATRVLEDGVPLRARMIHDVRGGSESQAYDPHGQCINSIDRGLLNLKLLEEVLSSPGVRVFFLHKLLKSNFDTKLLTFAKDDEPNVDVYFDLCIGADGSYSAVRRDMMRFAKMNYEQEYITHEYVELRMPARTRTDGSPSYRLDPNHLHIWPRHSFMLIALPNKDYTFTCTLFAPAATLASLRTREETLAWFSTHFPDAVAHIGEQNLLDDFEANPKGSLICIKTHPYHYKDSVILLGDASHSMVPFYGQGLNCGLEDVRVLRNVLRNDKVDPLVERSGAYDATLELALRQYSTIRHDDLIAICDMAMDNYVEMRHSVTTPTYRILKAIDHFISSWTRPVPLSTLTAILSRVPFPRANPGGWLSLYTMVTFRPDIPYALARRRAQRQSGVLKILGLSGVGLIAAGLVYSAKVVRAHRRFQGSL